MDRRVRQAAEMLGIGQLLERRPRELSGGQRQRVAIGRAIVRDARLFLFDEPLSNLDAQLRDEMRAEIKRLHQDLKRTMIYVTHDQIEAMTLADRIVLLRDGTVEQQGSPLELFENPASRFVAAFLGSPRMNFIPVRLEGNKAVLEGGPQLPIPLARRLPSGPAVFGIRPQHVYRSDGTTAAGRAAVEASVELVQITGTRVIATLAVGKETVVADLDVGAPLSPGERILVEFDMARAGYFEPRSGLALRGAGSA
jgi:multiple sugar transport system ATP-binding protein